jgi:hypothetical protein
MPTEVEIALPVMTPAQRHMNASARRFNVYRCGRRFGKDVLMERRLIRRVEKTQLQAWFAPTYRVATENYKVIKDKLAPITTRATESLHRLELVNGATIEFWSLDNIDAARGRKYGHVTINEAAQAPNLKDAWNFVIRPTLADTRGGADIGGTPKGLNFFYELERDNATNPDWAAFHYTTYDNPHIPRDEIEAMKQSLPSQVFQQEILAEYVESGSFFQKVQEACVIDAPDDPAAHIGHRFTAGLDWALTEDFTRLTILCATCGKCVDWWGGNRMDYAMQIEFIIDRLKKWPGVSVMPERNSMGQPNIEQLNRRGVTMLAGPDKNLGFYTTATTKPELIMKLALALEKQEIKLPREYEPEMLAYEVEMSTVNPKFGAPSGQHDDRVISAALAWWGCATPIQVFI